MNGIFAVFAKNRQIDKSKVENIASSIYQRGKNSSSLLISNNYTEYVSYQSCKPLSRLLNKIDLNNHVVIGYAGLNVSHPSELPPFVQDDFILFHSGLVNNVKVNVNEFRVSTPTNSLYILQKIVDQINKESNVGQVILNVMSRISGTVSCVLLAPKLNKVCLFSNHGGLYYHEDSNGIYVSSDNSFTTESSPDEYKQVYGVLSFDIDNTCSNEKHITYKEKVLFPYQDSFAAMTGNTKLLEYKLHNLRRCSKCVLPETMPYISFDSNGVCNYCHAYKPKAKPKNKEKIFELVKKYRKKDGYDCIIPFSGGRDSCYTLQVVIKELDLKPITYTYDWGMVTDVGRRNISLMCGQLGVPNIVIADDIEKKRKNIALNFAAWLKKPDLGMLNILSAGDKHFFRYIDQVKKQTGLKLNIWGVNPLEVTHFKTGFLGIKPDFEEQKVYASGMLGQLRYHSKRLRRMVKSPGYFNSSLWDTYSGEYYRSFAKKSDYFHTFDYWHWTEKTINDFLDDIGWEKASDTPTTWRIGDGTAGIYNYINYTLAGFTEHDTFRSNQIREGEITREEALKLLEVENAPAHDNLRWYLASIGFDFDVTIKHINILPKLHPLLC